MTTFRDSIYVSLGGNLGNVPHTLTQAIRKLCTLDWVKKTAVSRCYMTSPVGVRRQPWFYNVCVRLDPVYEGDPVKMLMDFQRIESQLGRYRTRQKAGAPRPIDIDFLLWGHRVINRFAYPSLILPHPRMATRAFVLAPLAELLDGQTIIPGHRQMINELLVRSLSDPKQKICVLPQAI